MSFGPQPLRSRRIMIVGLFVAYTLLVALASWKHVFWSDEAQAWLIARDSSGVFDLVKNVRHEAHPPLWHLILYCITRFTWNPEWMKVPNVLCALVAAFLLLSNTVVPFWLRISFTFSYFLLFEYAVVDRNYMLGIMLLLAAATLMSNRKIVFRVPLLLSLACFTSLAALVVSVCMYLLHLSYTGSQAPRTGAAGERGVPRVGRAAAMALFVISCVLSIGIIVPPGDSYREPGGFRHWVTLKNVLGYDGWGFAHAYVPIPRFRYHFWDTQWHFLPSVMIVAIGWLIFALMIAVLRDRRVRLFFIASSLALTLAEPVWGFVAEHRAGWLFLAFILSTVLDYTIGDCPQAKFVGNGFPWRVWVLVPLFVVQVTAGIATLGISLWRPFSPSLEVANFLREQHMSSASLIVNPDTAGLAVLAYLKRPNAYYLETGQESSFAVWNRMRHEPSHIYTAENLQRALRRGQNQILIRSWPLTPEEQAGLGVSELASFTNGICGEQYFLYRQVR